MLSTLHPNRRTVMTSPVNDRQPLIGRLCLSRLRCNQLSPLKLDPSSLQQVATLPIQVARYTLTLIGPTTTLLSYTIDPGTASTWYGTLRAFGRCSYACVPLRDA